jgi:hypothetical protein
MTAEKRLTELQHRMLNLIAEAGSQIAAARILDVDDALLHKVAKKGHIPRDRETRAKFGLPYDPDIETPQDVHVEPGSWLPFPSRECNVKRSKCKEVKAGVTRHFIPNHPKRRKGYLCQPRRDQ